MRVNPGQPLNSTDRVGSRLTAIRGGQPTGGGGGFVKLPWRPILIALGVVLVLVLLVLGNGVRQLKAPPPAIQKGTLGGKVPVRLVAVTRKAPQSYSYAPRGGSLAYLLGALGFRRNTIPVTSTIKLPDDALTLWFWIANSDLAPLNTASATDDTGRDYRNGSLVRPLTTGAQTWGRATLGYVSLSSYDHTAHRFIFTVPFGNPSGGADGVNQRIAFTVTGPAQAPEVLAPADDYPIGMGDGNAELRLWQLRPVDLATVRELLPLGHVPEPVDQLVLADVDLLEKGAASRVGRWFIEVLGADTDRGERLEPTEQRNGLAYLSNGRRPEGFEALKVHARASKIAVGLKMLKFRQLEVPKETGATVDWKVPAADPPFADGKFVAGKAMRSGPNLLRFEITGRGPADSDCSLSFTEALDQKVRQLKLQSDNGSAPAEARNENGGCFWRWSFDLEVQPDTEYMGLACRLDYRATVATTKADFVAKLQPPRKPADRAGIGVMVETRGEQVPKVIIVDVTAGSGAAQAGLLPGDELLSVDSMPAALLPRALMRRKPGEKAVVQIKRGEETLQAMVGLEPLG